MLVLVILGNATLVSYMGIYNTTKIAIVLSSILYILLYRYYEVGGSIPLGVN